MSDNIPLEAQELIRRFSEEEAIKAAERTSLRKPPRQESKPISKCMTTKEAESLALKFGCHIETGNGEHGKHIVAPNGDRRPLPDHGGGKSLTTGVSISIGKFIKSNGVQR